MNEDLNNFYFIDILLVMTIFIAGFRGRNISEKIIANQQGDYQETTVPLIITTVISFFSAERIIDLLLGWFCYTVVFSILISAFTSALYRFALMMK